MATTINADTTSGGAIITGDASGVLQLKTGGTTALTLGADQSATFASTVSGTTISGTTISGAISGTTGTFSGIVTFNAAGREKKTAISASDIDLTAGNYFSKTIAATTTFTVSNVPTTGTAASFILDLTNGGSQTINWWSGVKWAGGTAPTLTSSGRDALGFYTYDGGTTWTGLVLGKDIK